MLRLGGATAILVFSFLILSCFSEPHSHQEHDHIDNTAETEDYCLAEENFSPKCLGNEILVFNKALYGRMRAGRCLEDEELEEMGAYVSNSRILGCSVDVLQLMDRKCSGRQTCEIRGIDPDLKRERPCNKALKNYLEADYECVSVITEDRTCLVSASFNPVHIMYSSNMLNKLNCGTKTKPWRLEAPVGQHINISVLDFRHQSREASNPQQSSCHQYGYLVDKSAKKNVSICGLTKERQKLIYRSSFSAIDIYINAEITEDTSTEQLLSFLLRIVAVGCSDLIPPADAWLRRINDNEAVVGCYSSRQTWHLHCIGNNWVGVIGNCTRDEHQREASTPSVLTLSSGSNSQVLVIVAIGFLALVICLVIICCGAVCLQRYYMTVARKQWRKAEEIEKLSRFGYTGEKQTASRIDTVG